MRFFLKTKASFAKKRSDFDKSVPPYEDILIEVEKRQTLKNKEEQNPKKGKA